MASMNFAMRDLYPNMAGLETSVAVAPEPNDQDVLNEDFDTAQKASQTKASNKNIFIALIVVIALVVFLGR